MSAEPKHCTVYFDGACPLCRMEIGYYQRQAGADDLNFVDVSQPDAHLGPGLDRERSLARFHVRDADGGLLSGAAAFVALWRSLPRFVWLARVASVPGVLTVLEVGYRGFLRVRPLMQRLVAKHRTSRTPAASGSPRCAKTTRDASDA